LRTNLVTAPTLTIVHDFQNLSWLPLIGVVFAAYLILTLSGKSKVLKNCWIFWNFKYFQRISFRNSPPTVLVMILELVLPQSFKCVHWYHKVLVASEFLLLSDPNICTRKRPTTCRSTTVCPCTASTCATFRRGQVVERASSGFVLPQIWPVVANLRVQVRPTM